MIATAAHRYLSPREERQEVVLLRWRSLRRDRAEKSDRRGGGDCECGIGHREFFEENRVERCRRTCGVGSRPATARCRSTRSRSRIDAGIASRSSASRAAGRRVEVASVLHHRLRELLFLGQFKRDQESCPPYRAGAESIPIALDIWRAAVKIQWLNQWSICERRNVKREPRRGSAGGAVRLARRPRSNSGPSKRRAPSMRSPIRFGCELSNRRLRPGDRLPAERASGRAVWRFA